MEVKDLEIGRLSRWALNAEETWLRRKKRSPCEDKAENGFFRQVLYHLSHSTSPRMDSLRLQGSTAPPTP
jgi:hypothetical protein